MESDIFQILNHQLFQQTPGGYGQQRQSRPHTYRNHQTTDYHQFDNRISGQINHNDDGGTGNDDNDIANAANNSPCSPETESIYDRPVINEDLLQRQFNLYRYYVSQYPELFQAVQNLRQQQEQQQQQPSEEPESLPYLQDNGTSVAGTNNDNNQLQDSQDHQISKTEDTGQFLKMANKKNSSKKFNGDHHHHNKSDRCRLLCRCSKCCGQSDSSIWSESDMAMGTMLPPGQATSNHLYYLNANYLMEDERYEHLSRVITPPNAFLNKNQQQTENMVHYDGTTGKPVFYSDKLTQTDSSELARLRYQKLDKLSKKLQRQLSLVEAGNGAGHPDKSNILIRQSTEDTANRVSLTGESTDHIYYTISDDSRIKSESDVYRMPPFKPPPPTTTTAKTPGMADQSNNYKSFWQRKTGKTSDTKGEKTKSSPLFEHDLKQKSERPMLIYAGDTMKQPLPSSLMLNHENGNGGKTPSSPHRIATTKNGIPCACERCRESRGMNLTTELLPIDIQIPLQSMDNMDSFFQDSSMAELICNIM